MKTEKFTGQNKIILVLGRGPLLVMRTVFSYFEYIMHLFALCQNIISNEYRVLIGQFQT